MRAFLSVVDSIMALSLVLFLLLAFCTQIPREEQLNRETKVVYYRKVAEQILLTSAMSGYIMDLVVSFELGESLEPTVKKMLSLCPRRLSCLVEVRDSKGSILHFKGENPISPFGFSYYIATTPQDMLRILCRVGSN
jgi:hypothetical protein